MNPRPVAERPRLSVVGLGKLGTCMAASMASRGFEVVGVDVLPYVVEKVDAGEPPVVEPGLAERMAAGRERLRATSSVSDAVRDSDVTFLVVPTPSEEDGSFSLRYARQAAAEVGRALAEKDGYHLVVLTSTVLPGASESEIVPVLEEAARKRCGDGFGYCYSPEFIALGSVIRDFVNPDFVLVGESDPAAGELLEHCRREVCENDPPFARMSIANAELTKLAVNTYVTTKITFANMLAALCERLPAGDVDVVTSALGLDTRIGARYLKGGLGFGGPCFPRDNRALAHLARELGQDATLPESVDEVNRRLGEQTAERVLALAPPGAKVAVLGLAYKPDSPVIDDSQPLWLAQRLSDAGLDVVVYDPLAMENARAVLGDIVGYAESVQSAVEGADVVLVANPDPAFLGLTAEDFRGRERPVFVVDCWRMLGAALSGASNVEYVPLGVGPLRARVADTSNR